MTKDTKQQRALLIGVAIILAAPIIIVLLQHPKPFTILVMGIVAVLLTIPFVLRLRYGWHFSPKASVIAFAALAVFNAALFAWNVVDHLGARGAWSSGLSALFCAVMAYYLYRKQQQGVQA